MWSCGRWPARVSHWRSAPAGAGWPAGCQGAPAAASPGDRPAAAEPRFGVDLGQSGWTWQAATEADAGLGPWPRAPGRRCARTAEEDPHRQPRGRSARPPPPGGWHPRIGQRGRIDRLESLECGTGTARATDLAELVRVAGMRSAVEESFQTANGEVALDHYEVRRYDAWYRPGTPVGRRRGGCGWPSRCLTGGRGGGRGCGFQAMWMICPVM